MPDISVAGRYLPGDSPLHRMDPRTKLVLSLAFVAMAFAAQTPEGLALCAAFTALLFALGRIPMREAVRSLAPILLLALGTALLNVLFIQDGAALIEWGVVRVTDEGLARAGLVSCRLLLLLLGGGLLAFTTMPLDLADASERLMKPLARFGVPTHELSMMMGLALRFLPLFASELKTVYRAQISRGGALSKGRWGLLSSVVVPLFASAFRHADTLSGAMEARCYHGGTGRTRLHPMAFARRDAIGAAAMAAMLAAVIATNFIP